MWPLQACFLFHYWITVGRLIPDFVSCSNLASRTAILCELFALLAVASAEPCQQSVCCDIRLKQNISLSPVYKSESRLVYDKSSLLYLNTPSLPLIPPSVCDIVNNLQLWNIDCVCVTISLKGSHVKERTVEGKEEKV